MSIRKNQVKYDKNEDGKILVHEKGYKEEMEDLFLQFT